MTGAARAAPALVGGRSGARDFGVVGAAPAVVHRRIGAFRAAAHLSLGLFAGLLLWLALVGLAALTPVLIFVRGRFGVVDAVLRRLQRLESFRYATLLRAADVAPAGTRWAGFGDPAFWRMLSYALLRAPLSAVHAVALAFLVPIPLLVLAWTAQALPSGRAFEPFLSLAIPLLSVPWVLPLLARADLWLARVLLGREVAELEERVDDLVDSRRRSVDEADRERSRIERDLHDGAQQRLIALSILLGRAEQRLARGEASESLDAVRQAKGETLAVISEIRGLTRGLRPAVLESRGLDAALTGVIARLGLPCTVNMHLAARPEPAIESVLYFALSELITNVAKHAGANSASVVVTDEGRLIRAIVTDDGRGGADAALGSGLRGVADRLAGLDGRLVVSSPPGGPTMAMLEVPCAS